MTRPPGGPATHALICVVLGLLGVLLLGRACERVVPDVGSRVEVLPSIRAWDAGVPRD